MIARESNGTIYTHAGPEIGVASTKAFTAQLTALFLFAVYLGQVRGTLMPTNPKPLAGPDAHAGQAGRAAHATTETAKTSQRNTSAPTISSSWDAASTIPSRWKAR